jgi:hypothetical protein
MRQVILTVLLVLLCGPAAAQGLYEGTGVAVMGSDMTPAETEQLAFEKARSNALRKFGQEVRSAKAIQSASSRAGNVETLEEKIAVLAAGDASLVDGSKDVEREPTEAAVRYTVTARFEIDPPNFERTLKAYQNAGRGSDLRESISTTLDLQDRMMRTDENADPQEVSELLQKTKRLYETVAAYSRDVDARAASREMDQQSRRVENAIAQYIYVVLERGFPGDILEARVRRPNTRADGNMVEVEYNTQLRPTGFHEVKSSCREGARVWERSGSQKAEDLPFLRKPLTLLLLDENGDVLAVLGESDGGNSHLEIDYGSCRPRRMFDFDQYGTDHAHPEETWDFSIKRSRFQRIDEVVLGVAKENYEEISKKSGYRRMDYSVWVQPENSAISPEALLYTREDFRQEINGST